MSDKQRIMDMVKEGKISPAEALKLLEALDTGSPKYATVAAVPKGLAKMIRIVVDAQDIKVKVNVPASLARFASNFIPPEAKTELTAQGIDLSSIFDILKHDLPEGKIVDVEINDMSRISEGGSSISGPMKVIVEVI
jgi:hypothetical protein